MTEDIDSKLAALATKIDRESRITRSSLLLCTAAILGVLLYSVTIMVSDLPNVMMVRFLEDVDKVHGNWKALDRVLAKQNAAASTEAGSKATSEK